MGRKNIVVVGGGAAGVKAAKALSFSLDSSKYQLILINPLPYRIWLIASLRLIVSPQNIPRENVMLPYDRIFGNPHGKFIKGVVKSFQPFAKQDGGIITLESGEQIAYHVLVLAQGATWTGPPGFPLSETGLGEHIGNFHSLFGEARRIAIAGGGAVGIGLLLKHITEAIYTDANFWSPELAGEIKDTWPDKEVTIVHGNILLLNAAYPKKVRKAIEASIRARGINLILNDYVDIPDTRKVEGVTTRFRRELKDVDFVVQARGPRPNTAFVSLSIGAGSLSNTGLIRIRPTLQLKDYDNIFAAGDVIDWPEQKQYSKAVIHGILVADNVLAFLNKARMKDYKGSTETIIITNGKNHGVTYCDYLWGIIFGAWFTRVLKSKDLFISLFRSQQGY